MNFNFSDEEKIFILGAGSSFEYGLPTWGELENLIVEELLKDSSSYKFKQQLKLWLSMVGENKKYATIDQCIFKEADSSTHFDSGARIENELFTIFHEIFNRRYNRNSTGWISKLNQKILDRKGLENNLVFVNYNYDNVLNDNFLDYRNVSEKKRQKYGKRITEIGEASSRCLFPHGNLFPEVGSGSKIKREIQTFKTGQEGVHDAISCYDINEDFIVSSNYSLARNLYILGLGGGLEINLKRLRIDCRISDIYVTVHSDEKVSSVVKFLRERYQVPYSNIHRFKDCSELIEKCL